MSPKHKITIKKGTRGTGKAYATYYMCPISEDCGNKSCFMSRPHKQNDYARALGRTNDKKTIEAFNEVFTCKGKQLKLQEIAFKLKE